MASTNEWSMEGVDWEESDFAQPHTQSGPDVISETVLETVLETVPEVDLETAHFALASSEETAGFSKKLGSPSSQSAGTATAEPDDSPGFDWYNGSLKTQVQRRMNSPKKATFEADLDRIDAVSQQVGNFDEVEVLGELASMDVFFHPDEKDDYDALTRRYALLNNNHFRVNYLLARIGGYQAAHERSHKEMVDIAQDVIPPGTSVAERKAHGASLCMPILMRSLAVGPLIGILKSYQTALKDNVFTVGRLLGNLEKTYRPNSRWNSHGLSQDFQGEDAALENHPWLPPSRG